VPYDPFQNTTAVETEPELWPGCRGFRLRRGRGRGLGFRLRRGSDLHRADPRPLGSGFGLRGGRRGFELSGGLLELHLE